MYAYIPDFLLTDWARFYKHVSTEQFKGEWTAAQASLEKFATSLCSYPEENLQRLELNVLQEAALRGIVHASRRSIALARLSYNGTAELRCELQAEGIIVPKAFKQPILIGGRIGCCWDVQRSTPKSFHVSHSGIAHIMYLYSTTILNETTAVDRLKKCDVPFDRIRMFGSSIHTYADDTKQLYHYLGLLPGTETHVYCSNSLQLRQV